MTDLPSLPSEILISIARLLEDQQDRLALASCCRHFRALLLPEALASIELRSGCITSLSCLVQLLAHNPTLGAAVRSLSWDTDSCEHPQKLQFDHDLISATLAHLADTDEDLAKWRDDLQNRFENERSKSQEDAWWAILLTLVPNLERLGMRWEGPADRRAEIMRRALRHEKPFDSRPAFTRLEFVEIRRPNESPMILSDLLPFFKIPSVRTVLCDGIVDWAQDEQRGAIQELGRSSNVRDLALLASNSHTGFSSVILACARLETFLCANTMYAEQGKLWNPSAAWRALVAHKDTLKTIHVYNETAYGGSFGPEAKSFFGSMVNFSKLTKLRLDAINVLDWDVETRLAKNNLSDVLPPTIVFLEIYEFHECPNIEQLAEQLETTMRNVPSKLKYLGLSGFFCEPTWSGDPQNEQCLRPRIRAIAATLDAAAQATGVWFQLSTWSLDDPSPGWGVGIPPMSYRALVPGKSTPPTAELPAPNLIMRIMGLMMNLGSVLLNR
ncbi:F-box protein [Aspergillus mulundensis]|uniref:F-box domain-containing protein n=1 Tax=Aspergillus mulundensis TaxID=1810919 RepID=A0A3D8R4L4_9EURO|nr:hypothetical protein DSM5745_08755 [Aspergillus mulundensis]RDW68995.1 hypothetical protein DSM5745_08755 [Aspergillus mulundensis]